MTTFYTTKSRSATRGISAVTGRISDNDPDTLVTGDKPWTRRWYSGRGRNWHASLEEAQAFFLARVDREIARTKRTLARLEKLRVDGAEVHDFTTEPKP